MEQELIAWSEVDHKKEHAEKALRRSDIVVLDSDEEPAGEEEDGDDCWNNLTDDDE